MKLCKTCCIEKPLDQFAFMSKAKGTRQAKCRACVSAWDKQYYSSGKKPRSSDAYKIMVIQRNRDYVWELLSNSRCIDCGENNPIVLEFDHTQDDKIANIGDLIGSTCRLAKIQEEIAKCEIVCANCHRIRTATRSKSWRYIKSTA